MPYSPLLDSDFVPAKVPYDVERDDQDDDGDGGVDAVHKAKVVVPAGEGAVERSSERGQSLDDCLPGCVRKGCSIGKRNFFRKLILDNLQCI